MAIFNKPPTTDKVHNQETEDTNGSWSRWFHDLSGSMSMLLSTVAGIGSNLGLKLLDLTRIYTTTLVSGQYLTANRTLTIVPGDIDQTLTINGDPTLNTGFYSGLNTGDQTITLSGAVTGTGTGAITTTYAGTVGVTTGGTGVTTMTTAYAPVCAGTTATGALQVASTGLSTVGNVLTSTGASSVPTWQAVTSGMTFISSATASASATIDFTGLSGYTSYLVKCYGVRPVTGGDNLLVRISVATVFQTGAVYSWEFYDAVGGTFTGAQSIGTTSIKIFSSMSGGTNHCAGNIDLIGVGAGFTTAVLSKIHGSNNAGNMTIAEGGGTYTATSTVDGIRLFCSTGNISTGVFRLYGIT